jgi:hypothetical protein
MSRELIYIEEPLLQFRFNQGLEDPRDGLTLFGPLDAGKPYGIRAGVVGTADGIKRFTRFVDKLQRPLPGDGGEPTRNRPMFPGFEAVYGVPWHPQPVLQAQLDATALHRAVRIEDRHQRVYATVRVYADAILDAVQQEDEKADVWFVIVPDEVYANCRPRSNVPRGERVQSPTAMTAREAKRLQVAPSLFQFINDETVPYLYDPDFRNQLKALLLREQIATQILRESTIAYEDFLNDRGQPVRDLKILESEIAWNVTSAVFYKTGGRPWKLRAIRPGVCYIGLVFKQDDRSKDPRSACCAAQMFLDSGDGVVFKGNMGPWYNPGRGDYHLDAPAAKELVEKAIRAYAAKNDNVPPAELFIHGKTRFNDKEWDGFKQGAGDHTKVTGVRIVTDRDLRLFHPGETPALRGLAWIRDEKTAHLWTKGFVPRLQTYPGREVPLPLHVEVCRGDADVRVVVQDIVALTKLNYNSCRYADGIPVTLRFADAVGEILVSGPEADAHGAPPLSFKFYI